MRNNHTCCGISEKERTRCECRVICQDGLEQRGKDHEEIPEDIVKELSLQIAMATAVKCDMEEGTVMSGADTIVVF